MTAYSLDLREKIVEAYLHNEGSIRHLAKRFNVSACFVWGLMHRFRSTGHCAPKPHGGGNPPRIAASQYETVTTVVKHYPDATLQELCDHVEATCHITPSQSSLHRTLDTLHLTRKKRAITQPSVTLQTSTPNGTPIKST